MTVINDTQRFSIDLTSKAILQTARSVEVDFDICVISNLQQQDSRSKNGAERYTNFLSIFELLL